MQLKMKSSHHEMFSSITDAFSEWRPNRFDELVFNNEQFLRDCLHYLFTNAPNAFVCQETSDYLNASSVLWELSLEVAEEHGYTVFHHGTCIGFKKYLYSKNYTFEPHQHPKVCKFIGLPAYISR